MPRDQQFRAPLNGRPAPRVAHAADDLFLDGGRGFAVNVLPNFVDLNVVNLDAPDALGFHLGALLADENQQIQDRANMGIGHAGDAADGHALAQ
jgi:hypothetical protein